VILCDVRRRNGQIHRQRALSDSAGAGSPTRTTYRTHALLAPPGSIPTHAAIVPVPELHGRPPPGKRQSMCHRGVLGYNVPARRPIGRRVIDVRTSAAPSRAPSRTEAACTIAGFLDRRGRRQRKGGHEEISGRQELDRLRPIGRIVE
jgi:hypothetical protein